MLFLVAVGVAAIEAVASPHTNQRSLTLSTALPAKTIVVTNINDSGPGSLRDALAVATDGDTIDATGVSGTILLTSGELQNTHNVTISGPGANNLAVDGNAQSRVFYVNLGKTVTISGLTIRNGSKRRGGIYNDGGALTLSDCTVSGNSITAAGSQATTSGRRDVTITNSTLSGNSADYGGGIATGSGQGGGAIVTVSNSTVSGNWADYGGGGIANAVHMLQRLRGDRKQQHYQRQLGPRGRRYLQLEQRRRRGSGYQQHDPEGGHFGRKHLQFGGMVTSLRL